MAARPSTDSSMATPPAWICTRSPLTMPITSTPVSCARRSRAASEPETTNRPAPRRRARCQAASCAALGRRLAGIHLSAKAASDRALGDGGRDAALTTSVTLERSPRRTASRTASIVARASAISHAGRPSGSGRPRSFASSLTASCGRVRPTIAMRSPSLAKPRGAVLLASGSSPTMPTTGVG